MTCLQKFMRVLQIKSPKIHKKCITCLLKSVGLKCILMDFWRYLRFWLYYCLTDLWRYLKIKCLQKSMRIYFSPTDLMDFTDFWRYTQISYIQNDFTKKLNSWKFLKMAACTSQCGNWCNIVSHIFGKNFVKVTFLLKS